MLWLQGCGRSWLLGWDLWTRLLTLNTSHYRTAALPCSSNLLIPTHFVILLSVTWLTIRRQTFLIFTTSYLQMKNFFPFWRRCWGQTWHTGSLWSWPPTSHWSLHPCWRIFILVKMTIILSLVTSLSFCKFCARMSFSTKQSTAAVRQGRMFGTKRNYWRISNLVVWLWSFCCDLFCKTKMTQFFKRPAWIYWFKCQFTFLCWIFIPLKDLSVVWKFYWKNTQDLFHLLKIWMPIMSRILWKSFWSLSRMP